jgi:hypothetical protein
MRNKWELIEENVVRHKVVGNFLLGTISEGDVYVDIYKKRRWNGSYKYKVKER